MTKTSRSTKKPNSKRTSKKPPPKSAAGKAPSKSTSKKTLSKHVPYLELFIKETPKRIELHSEWLVDLLAELPKEALPKNEVLLRTRAGRSLAGHVLWQGRSVLSAFNDHQVNRILANWLPHWARRDTWVKAVSAMQDIASAAPTNRCNEPACWMAALPRSGSNYVMQVLASMAKGEHYSIYGHLGKIGSRTNATVVRSHALTFKQLDEELQRFTGKVWNKETPVVALVRDPRDIAISFYEYTQFVLKVKIPQEQFLNGVDYYLASGIDLGGSRRSSLAPTSVIQAMRQFINNWLAEENGNDAVHLVRFEDLLSNPKVAFVSLASTLDLPQSTPSPTILGKHVARYDRKQRPRGVAQGWKQLVKRYAVLIDGVERELSAEMRLLGYELGCAQASSVN